MSIEGLGNTYAIPKIDKDRETVTERKKRDGKKDKEKKDRENSKSGDGKSGKIDIRI